MQMIKGDIVISLSYIYISKYNHLSVIIWIS